MPEQIFGMGLQKAGTTVTMAAVAAAIGVQYSPEAVYFCGCLRCAQMDQVCYPNGLVSGPGQFAMAGLFGDNMSRFFATCHHQLTATVVKADDMLASAPLLHAFIVQQGLPMRLVYISRHPFDNIRSLLSWGGGGMTAAGKRMLFREGRGVPALARLWAHAARTYLGAPHIFAAHIRYEDMLASPMETVDRVVNASFPLAARIVHIYNLNGTALHAALRVQHHPRGHYNHTELPAPRDRAHILNACGAEMEAFGYRPSQPLVVEV